MFSKKILILIVVILVIVYLNRAYAHFYDLIGEKNLIAPSHQTQTILKNGQSKNLNYVVLGDSLSAGVGASQYQNTWPYLFAKQLLKNNSQITMNNFSFAGAQTNDVIKAQIPQISNLPDHPDVITVLIGINDLHNLKSTSEFKENYQQIIAHIKTTRAKIILVNIPYLASPQVVNFPYNILLNWRTEQYNQIIKQISQNYNLEYIDLYSATKQIFSSDPSLYSSDGFHPNDQGYQLWGDSINEN